MHHDRTVDSRYNCNHFGCRSKSLSRDGTRFEKIVLWSPRQEMNRRDTRRCHCVSAGDLQVTTGDTSRMECANNSSGIQGTNRLFSSVHVKILSGLKLATYFHRKWETPEKSGRGIQRVLYRMGFWVIFTCMVGLRQVNASISASSGGQGKNIAGNVNFTPLQGVLLWLSLFTLSAAMHSAESAITKISPWKVQVRLSLF